MVRDFRKKLRLGFHWGFDAQYFISEYLAFGVKFSSFRSSNSSNDIQTTFSDGTVEQGLKETIKIRFVGPTVLTRFLSANEQNALISMIGIGYLDYSNPVLAGSRSYTASGGAFGLSADIGYDLGLSETISIGIATSAIIGAMNKLQLEDNGTTQTIDLSESGSRPESLAHYTLSVGLKIHL